MESSNFEKETEQEIMPLKQCEDILNKFAGIRKATKEEKNNYCIINKIKNDNRMIIIFSILIILSLLLILINDKLGLILLMFFIICLFSSIKSKKKNNAIKKDNVYVADCKIYKKWKLSDPDSCLDSYYIKVWDNKKYFIDKNIKLNNKNERVYYEPEAYNAKLYVFVNNANEYIIDLLIEKIER